MTGIKYPVAVRDIEKIERLNPNLFPCGINVFSLDDSNKPFPMRISPLAKHDVDNRVVNLLYYNNHYAWIKDFSRFIKSTITAHKTRTYFCYSCLNGFQSREKLIDHNRYCFETKKITAPAEGKNLLYFKKFERTRKLPFVMYGDFESFIVPVNDGKCVCSQEKCQCDVKTIKVNKHVPASYRLMTTCIIDKLSRLSPIYRGSDPPPEVHMLKYLFKESERIDKLAKLDDQFSELRSFKENKRCCICRGNLHNDRLPYYDFIKDRYLGAAHTRCRVVQPYIPVVFHNLRGYDGHFIVRALGHPDIVSYMSENNLSIKCIPNNSERLMSITVGNLRFIDSIQFMSTSLDNLAKNCSSFPILSRYFNESQVKYLTKKGIFPYEYFDGPARFNEPTLPDKDRFYSSMTEKNITDAEYAHAGEIWKVFGCRNFGDYHDLYLTVDVLLLADIFEKFRETAMNQYGLDPAHYYSAPGLSWDALLKLTKIKFELLTDPDMYLFIERGIRGGISVITKKYAAANNKYLHDYNPNLPVNYITYLDKNNLYDTAMSQPMSHGGFKWISEEEFLSQTFKDGKFLEMSPTTSYYIEADFDYPASLHDAHNDYPFLPESLIITDDMLSKEQVSLKTTKPVKIHKLVPNLRPKTRYVCHYAILKQAIDAGLILTRIHKVLQFNHSTWMKEYINGNTTRRAAATNQFEKDFYKIMNNAVFGKTMENIRKRVDIRIVNDKDLRNKLLKSNCFLDKTFINNNLMLIKMLQPTLHLSKPIYVGAAVLDLSKHIMFNFHYGFAKLKWPNVRLLFTDTDSLVYEIPGTDCNDDLFQDIYNNRELFDLSDVKGKFNDNTNKKVIGKFKDEYGFDPIREFVGLRSKMYSLISESSKETKKAKGVSNSNNVSFVIHPCAM